MPHSQSASLTESRRERRQGPSAYLISPRICMVYIRVWIVRESFFSRRLTAASFGSIKRITAGSPSIQQSVPQRRAAAELRSRGHRKRMCSTNAHNVSLAHRISGSAAAVKNKSPRQHEICKAASSQRNNWSLFSIRRSCMRRRTIKK